MQDYIYCGEVYLEEGRYITVGGALASSPAATIMPARYETGYQVLDGSSALVSACHGNFEVTNDSQGGS